MSSIKRKTTYFTQPGEHNTNTVLKLAKEYAQTQKITHIIVASTTGKTGAKAAKTLKNHNVIVVTHHVGFGEPNTHELKEEYKQQILKHKAKILTSTHALSSVERAIRKKFQTLPPLELIAHTLRLLGEGTKVCVEITLMAADAGLIPTNKDIIAIAGTGRGADTALIIKPATASEFFNLKIKEIITKPKNFK
jgi:hypothetical protein